MPRPCWACRTLDLKSIQCKARHKPPPGRPVSYNNKDMENMFWAHSEGDRDTSLPEKVTFKLSLKGTLHSSSLKKASPEERPFSKVHVKERGGGVREAVSS